MKRNGTIAYLALLLALLVANNSYGQSDTNLIEGLKSSDADKRQQTIESLNHQRDEIIEKLIGLLKGDFSSEVKDAAAKLLGDYRASEAVNVLMQNIELDLRPRLMIALLTEEGLHPISAALGRIGTPSIPFIIRTLEENDNSKVGELLLRVLYRIEGEKDMAQLRVQKALAAQQDAKKKARLEAALKTLLGPHFGK